MARRKKAVRGRPKIDDPKNKLIKIRVTESEQNSVAEKASNNGLSITDYVRSLLFDNSDQK